MPWVRDGTPVDTLASRSAGILGLECETGRHWSISEVAMGNLHQVAWAGAHLLLLFGRSALLAEQSVTYWPSQLTREVDETAVFTCRFSNMDVSQTPGNWYKVSENGQPRKISELKENGEARDPKYAVARVDAQTFEMRILNLSKNDSGTYYCGHISVSSLDKPIRDSNRANLTVTEKAKTPAKPTEEREEEEEMGGRKYNTLPLAVFGGAGLLLVLAFLCFFLWDALKRKQVARKLQEENAPLEEEPPAVTVFTVDYGVLAFPPTESARDPPRRVVLEQTEYATIVFPQEGQDKRTKKLRNYPGRAHPN